MKMNIKNISALLALLLTGLFLCPQGAWAQDEEDTDDEDATVVRTFTVKAKQYETRTVKGRVLDAATRLPISGAIVRAAEVDGYSVLTDDDGTYELKLPVFSTALIVSSPDYNMVRMSALSGEMQKTALLYSANFTPEYGLQTNAQNAHTATGFQYSPSVNIKDEIQSRLGSVAYTTTHNGTPGIGSVMFVQGLNSLNLNAQPLVVIDDVIIDQQYGRELLHDGIFNDVLSNINLADIEKVTVLRNGTALYGAKGANGVVLIQTRRNKSMATRITASLSGGVTFEPKYYSMMNGDQYRGYASGMLKSVNTSLQSFRFLTKPGDFYHEMYHQDSDWKDLVYRTAFTQNYGINVEGGDEAANYNLSVGYTNAQSTMKANDMDRMNIRFNTDITLTKKFSIRFDASFADQTRNLRNDGAPAGYEEGTPTSLSFLGYVKNPFVSPNKFVFGKLTDLMDLEDETYLKEALASYQYNWKLAHPGAIISYGEGEIKNRFETSMLNLTVTPKVSFNPHLFISEHFSYNLVNTSENLYVPVNGVPSYFVKSLNGYRENEVRALASKQNSVMSDTRIDWNNRYDAHYFHLFGGVRVNWETFTTNSKLGYNTGSDKTPFMDALSAGNIFDEGQSDSWTNMAWYGQAEYNYKSRYYLQANVGVEASSRFGKDAGWLKVGGVAWGVFPGVQASWVVTNEPWLSHVSGLDYLRLTAGYDVSGNDDINLYASQSYFSSQQFLHQVSALAFEGIGNTKIQWETTRRLNLGFESSLMGNRLGLTFNYFRSTTDNLVTRRYLGFLSGIDQNWANGGKLQNEGFDVQATAKLVATKDWQWQLGASVGHYKNKVTELPSAYIDNEVYGATIRTQEGQAANLFYGFKTDGVFASSADPLAAGKNGEALYMLDEDGLTKKYFEAGDMHFFDRNGDGIISDGSFGNADDRVVIGDPNPDIYGNIFTSVSWKRFKLDARFNYSLGNDVYNYMRAQLEGGSRFMNQTKALNRRWQVEGQQTDVPRITFQDPMGNSRFSDRWIEDGSYLRLKSVTLSYELPLKSEFIQGLQFWVQGNNLLTLSRYLGGDPEFSMTSSVIGQGIDLGQLPQSRSVVAGVKINL